MFFIIAKAIFEETIFASGYFFAKAKTPAEWSISMC